MPEPKGPQSKLEKTWLEMINVWVLVPICDSLSQHGEGLTRVFIKREAFGFSAQSPWVCTGLTDTKRIGLIESFSDSLSSLSPLTQPLAQEP